MSELLGMAPVVIVAFILGILIGMGIQVRSEKRWIKQPEDKNSGRSGKAQCSFRLHPRARNGCKKKSDWPDPQ